ncbi:MAG TPA: hypothetical protein VGI67_20925 [Thermoleophilaceae bacterium]
MSAAALSAAAALLVIAPSANAGVLVKSATNCPNPPVAQPFSQWGDHSTYMLAPNGSFEGGAGGWSLHNASIVSGNESYNVAGSGSHSLQIKPGGSALTSTICVGLDRPTLRLFAHSSGGLLGIATMAVSVRFETSLGLVAELPIGVVLPSSKWQPSLPLPILANLLPLLPGQMTPVQFRFTPVLGTWNIDDVYVDPRMRG